MSDEIERRMSDQQAKREQRINGWLERYERRTRRESQESGLTEHNHETRIHALEDGQGGDESPHTQPFTPPTSFVPPISFWPRLVYISGDPGAWHLYVRKGWRMVLEDDGPPEEIAPAEGDEFDLGVIGDGEYRATLTYSLAAEGSWASSLPILESGHDPAADDKNKRVFVFCRVVKAEGGFPVLSLGDIGDAIVHKPSDKDPLPVGATDPGASVEYSRADHVHSGPTTESIQTIITNYLAAEYETVSVTYCEDGVEVTRTFLAEKEPAS